LHVERSEIESRAKRVLLSVLDIDESTLRPDLNLVAETGADSLDVMEVFLGLEEEFDIEFPPEAVEEVRTLEQAVNLISELAAGRQEA
jgi:acyl carrier protein